MSTFRDYSIDGILTAYAIHDQLALVATGKEDGSIDICSDDGKHLEAAQHQLSSGKVTQLAWHSAQKHLAAGFSDGTAFRAGSLTAMQRCRGCVHQSAVACAFGAQGVHHCTPMDTRDQLDLFWRRCTVLVGKDADRFAQDGQFKVWQVSNLHAKHSYRLSGAINTVQEMSTRGYGCDMLDIQAAAHVPSDRRQCRSF
jgi:hypothetical protein